MPLTTQTGMKEMDNVRLILGRNIDYVGDDGRVAFSITVGDDGKSLEIYTADCMIDGVFHNSQIQVTPRCANRITVRTTKIDA
jgi:hypothetical protein